MTLRKWWVGYKAIFKPYSYLNTTGFIRSHQKLQPINARNEAIPWMNYAFVELLDERLNRSLRMFEYGAGFSSLYFSNRVKEIVSIEYDKAWENKLRALLKSCTNHNLLVEPVGNEYIHAPERKWLEPRNGEMAVTLLTGYFKGRFVLVTV